MQRGRAVKISAGQNHSFGNIGLIEGAYRISGKTAGGSLDGGTRLLDGIAREKPHACGDQPSRPPRLLRTLAPGRNLRRESSTVREEKDRISLSGCSVSYR